MPELIDIYDEAGQKTGKTAERDEVHQNGLIHKAVCVWIMNSHNELLLQTRSSHVMLPDMMDSSFSGHIQAGESALNTVIREGYEELGIQIEPQRLRYLFSCRAYCVFDGYFENEIDDIYLYTADIPAQDFHLCDKEVGKVSYIDIESFKRMVECNAEVLVPYETHYRFLLDTLHSRLLSHL